MTVDSPLKKLILHMVETNQGIKGVELALKVMSEVNPILFKVEEFQAELLDLIAEGRIIEFEYTLPSMTYRVKSIYFPKGTTFGINSHVEKESRIHERRNAEAGGA